MQNRPDQRRPPYRKRNGVVTSLPGSVANVVVAWLCRGVLTALPIAARRHSAVATAARVQEIESRALLSGSVLDVSAALAGIDGIAYVAHGVNERRIADLSSQASDENLHQLGVIFVRVFPYSFA
jgi:hypothetical protein